MNAHVSAIWRHPIKAHGREELARTLLTEGALHPVGPALGRGP